MARIPGRRGRVLSPAAAAAPADAFPCSPRASDVLELIAQGLDNAQIAARLELSEKTVRNNITHIFDKIEVENRSQAIVLAREAGLGAARPSAERDRGPACFPLPAPVSGLRPHAAAGSLTIASPIR